MVQSRCHIRLDSDWRVFPADDKDNARLIVSHLVLNALDELDMPNTKVTEERRIELRAIREATADRPEQINHSNPSLTPQSTAGK